MNTACGVLIEVQLSLPNVLIVAYVSIANHMKPYFFFSATGTLGEQWGWPWVTYFYSVSGIDAIFITWVGPKYEE